jgi:hypothetical protein
VNLPAEELPAVAKRIKDEILKEYVDRMIHQVETILEGAAIPMDSGTRTVRNSAGATVVISWGPGQCTPACDADGAGFITADAALAATP